jgi:type IV pilus assembly protein PilP
MSQGCKKGEDSPPPPPSQTNAAKVKPPVQKQQSSAQISPTAQQATDFTSKKDPFKPFMPVAAQSAKQAGSSRSTDLLPIQSYELSKFRVAGIIVGLKENSALVIDPSGKGYVVKEGMLIGDSDGRITKITATSIEVLEKYQAENGRIKSRLVKLTLPKKK